ncbi:MAG: helix-turn-helix domain-containing protein [Azoarcus sp.]|nr:helix-turn-helix domain-containing protein [Azoarcus sp.]
MTQQSIPDMVATQRDLLTPSDVANELKVKVTTLAIWRTTGRHRLPFVKIGRAIRYRRSDLDTWLAERARTNGATAGGAA